MIPSGSSVGVIRVNEFVSTCQRESHVKLEDVITHPCIHCRYEVFVEEVLCDRDLTRTHCHQFDVAIVPVCFEVINVGRQAEQHLPCLLWYDVMFFHGQKIHTCKNCLRDISVPQFLENLALVLVATIPSRFLACLLLVSIRSLTYHACIHTLLQYRDLWHPAHFDTLTPSETYVLVPVAAPSVQT